ncbi:MAG: DMT family transporter [Proteobacteria bacterium]|nr:DMT family transporter [Pseudomonadota bacterium]
MKQNNLLLPYTAATLALVFWGLSFVGTKIALTGFSAFSLIFIRVCIASLFFGAWMLWRGFPKLRPRDHARMFLISIFQPWLYFIFETTGLQYTSASKASLIIAIIPVVVLFLSAVFFNEKIRILNAGGIACSLLGVFLLISGGEGFEWRIDGSTLGDVLLFGAVISAAIYIMLVKNLGKSYSPIQITAMQFIYGTVLFAPEFFWELSEFRWEAIHFNALAAVLALALFATIGGFLCYNYALSRISATQAAIFLNGVPVVTVIGAWLILGERMTLIQILGGFVVLLGVYLANSVRVKPNTVELEKVSTPEDG